MKIRNEYLELDGLFWESETHEWFNDKSSTQYACKKSAKSSTDDSLNIICFVVRNKSTGEYDRIIMDKVSNKIIYESKSLEDICYFIDKLKIKKRFQ